MSFFDAAFAIVVGIEGGYVNDPADPGGETRFGISKRQYPQIDIASLTLDQAKALYLRNYWNVCRCDELPWDMALAVFDCAVNSGVGAAKELHASTADTVEFMAARALRYASDKNFQRYGKGWFRRLFTIFKAAQRTPQ